MTEPSTEFYTVTIQKPDGDGWATVHTKTNATGRSAADLEDHIRRLHTAARDLALLGEPT